MDPDVALALAWGPNVDSDTRREAAAGLVDWIESGGFLPDVSAIGQPHASTLLRELRYIATHGRRQP